MRQVHGGIFYERDLLSLDRNLSINPDLFILPWKLTQITCAKLLELYHTSEIWVNIRWYFAGIYHTITGENSASLLRKIGVTTASNCTKNTNHQVPVKTFHATQAGC